MGFVVLCCTSVRCRACKCSMDLCLFAAAEFALVHVQVCENVCLCARNGDALLNSQINDIHEA